MNALVLDATARTATLQHIPISKPEPGELLVKVEAIALNPVDPLYVQHPLGTSGRTIGSDFVGKVVAFGNGSEELSGLVVGERVAGFLQGASSANERPGAFAEYLHIPWDLVWKVPEHAKAEEAAGVSLVALTAAQSIWFRLGLEAPFPYDVNSALREHPEWTDSRATGEKGPQTINFFIYGASTSVALFAAQMVQLSAAASGQKVRLFGAASRARWEMLQAKPYGYEKLVDYRDADWPEQIRRLTGNEGVHYAYDCISEGASVEKVSSVLAVGAKSAVVRSRAGRAWTGENLPVEPIYGAVWEGLGEEIQYQGFKIHRSPAAREFAVRFYAWLGQAIGRELKPIPIRLMPGGLSKVAQDGFALLGSGKMQDRQMRRSEEWMQPVSAEKLVYRL